MTELTELLKRWSSLPDEAVVNSKLTAAITGLSERTVRYERVYLTKTRYGQRVGDIRKMLGSLSASGRAA